MKTETNQTSSYIRKTIKSKCKHILRDLTPDIRRPTLTISTFNDIFVPTQTNQSITLLKSGKSRSKRVISSYSPERYIHHTHNKSIIYGNNSKARSISKKSGSNYKKCCLKRNYGFNSSRSKNGKIVKKTIPTLVNKRKRNSSYSKNKGNSMNNLFYVQAFKMPSLSLSSMLNDKEKKCIEIIAKKMFMLVNESKNKEVVINELEMIVQMIKSGKFNNNSNGSNSHHHNCKSETKNGNDLIKNNSVNSYHSKGRNNNNMNDVKKNLKSFKKIKMQPKNITDEVDQMKYQYNITQLNNNNNNIRTNINNSKPTNNNNKVNVNKSKISMKNASLNLHMIPKVNGIEKQSKHSGNDSSQLIINNTRSNGGNIKNEDHNNNIHLLELRLDEIQNNKVRNFNDEFLENYEEFSPSWRLEIDKMNQRKNY